MAPSSSSIRSKKCVQTQSGDVVFENITLTISPTELKQLITTATEEQMGRKVKDITFVIPTQSVGYGTMERSESVFAGATVTFMHRVDE